MLYLDSLLAKIPRLDFNPYLKSLWPHITFESVLKFMVIYFAVLWIAVVIWVIKDIINRTDSILLQVVSILIVLLGTPLWIFVYLIIRPWKTIFEKYYEEIEDNLDCLSDMMQDKNIGKPKKIRCYNCNEKLDEDFSFCPKCKEKLKEECKKCKKEIRIWWDICPYCWKETWYKKPDSEDKKDKENSNWNDKSGKKDKKEKGNDEQLLAEWNEDINENIEDKKEENKEENKDILVKNNENTDNKPKNDNFKHKSKNFFKGKFKV